MSAYSGPLGVFGTFRAGNELQDHDGKQQADVVSDEIVEMQGVLRIGLTMQMLLPLRRVWPSLVFFFLPSGEVSLSSEADLRESTSRYCQMLELRFYKLGHLCENGNLLLCHILKHHVWYIEKVVVRGRHSRQYALCITFDVKVCL